MLRRIGLFLLFFLCFLFLSGCDDEQIVSGNIFQVKRVIDGDTIELTNSEKVRYLGIDTPETSKRSPEGDWVYNPQPYAEMAKDFNKKLVEGKSVRLEFDVEKRDKYNRLLAYCFVGDAFVNVRLLEEGLAMLYTSPPNVKYADLFVEKAKTARSLGKGIWSDDQTLSMAKAKDFIGQVKTLEGQVSRINKKDGVTIIGFTGENGKHAFKAVIFKGDSANFRKKGISIDDYLNKKVRIWGMIKEYKSGPEIIIRDPSQIEIVNE